MKRKKLFENKAHFPDLMFTPLEGFTFDNQLLRNVLDLKNVN